MATRSLTPLPKGFHGDRYLLRLVDALAGRVETFLETGSNVGSTLGYVARRYPGLDCLSCEPEVEAFRVARDHAGVRPGVEVFPETSQDFLRRLGRDHSQRFERPFLAWLDAHGYGFEWPLREEVAFLTQCFDSGYVLIDDFRVPEEPAFGWDAYGDRCCEFDYVRGALDPRVAWRLYYPAYREHTSPWHPLRGWGLLQFGPAGSELERLETELPEILSFAESSSLPAGRRAAVQACFEAGEFDRAEAMLRTVLAERPDSATAWNDLGACLAHLGAGEEALQALTEALRLDPRHAAARGNYGDVLRAREPGSGLPLPVAAGSFGPMTTRDPFEDLAQLVDLAEPTIVDGGAHGGHTVARLRERFPGARIHAFEPIPERARAVRERFAEDPHLVVHQAALAAEEGELTLGVRHNDATSSRLAPSALKRRYHDRGLELERELTVLALRLDRAVPKPIDILKLDLQGGELDALCGLGERLAEVRAVLTEVEFVPLYEGQPLFADLDTALRGAGFRLFHLYDIWSHPDGQTTSGDALYVNRRHYA